MRAGSGIIADPMAPVLVAANADQIIQVSGRPLSAQAEETSAAAGHLICDDAVFLHDFASPAPAARHFASRWLSAALVAAARRGRNYRDVLAGLVEEADASYRSAAERQDLSPADRRLTIMFSGYTEDDFIVNAFVSNFRSFAKAGAAGEARDRFSLHVERSISRTNGNPGVIHLIGESGALADPDEQALREMLLRRSPAETIRQKALTIVRAIAARPGQNGPIPAALATARLDHADPLAPLTGDARHPTEERGALLNRVDLRSAAAGVATPPRDAAALPKVHRNAPCPCGSGKRYRDCHRPADVAAPRPA